MQFLAHFANDGSREVGRIPQFYSDVQAAKYANTTLEGWRAMHLYDQQAYIASMNAETDAQIELKRFNDEKHKG